MRYLLPNWPQTPQLLEEESMVNLAHLFDDHDQAFELVFLKPEPWLRHTFKENWLLPQRWWSVFDAIQGINIQTGHPVGLEDLDLPVDTERVFSQSQITFNREDRLYASVKAFPSGFITSVVLPNAQQGRTEERFYDDRGFLSYQTISDEEGHRLQCQWFNLSGSLVMTQNQAGVVTIAAEQMNRFERAHYDNLDQVILEKVTQHFQIDQDPELIAMAGMNQTLLQYLMAHYPVTMLVEEHLSRQEQASVVANGPQATHIVSPTDHFARYLQTKLSADVSARIAVIPPYATKLTLGTSNEADQTILMWYVNRLPEARLAVVFPQLLRAMVKEERRRLLVIADNDEQVQHLKQAASRFLAQQAGVGSDSSTFVQIAAAIKQWEDAANQSDTPVENAQMPEPPAPSPDERQLSDKALQQRQVAFQIFRMLTHIHYAIKPSVGQMKTWLTSSRLLIDLGEQPNLLLQIGAISVAIPQINRRETGYVEDAINGTIINEDRDLADALSAYLDALTVWNRAVVANVKRIDAHDDNQLMRLWKKVLTHG